MQGFIQVFIPRFTSHHLFLCRVLDASTPSYQNAAVSTYFHSLKGVSSGTKETSNEMYIGILLHRYINSDGPLNYKSR
nr:hypothetical protein Iba_chr03dCG6470 [Ipomoea batatas]GMC76357.1 hypothetical protein Iba_chr03eCG0380 [Ipomoea batatas]